MRNAAIAEPSLPMATGLNPSAFPFFTNDAARSFRTSRCDLPIALRIRPNSSLSLSRMKNVICDVSEDDGFLALSSFFIIS